MPDKSFWLDAWWPVMLVIGLAFVSFLVGLILLLRARTQTRGGRQGRAVPLTLGALSLFGLMIALTGTIFLFQFGSYRKLSEWEVVARVKCGPRGRIGEYDLEFSLLAGGKVHHSRRYEVFGDRWSLKADVIEWRAPLRALGLHRSIKIIQIESVYDRERDYLERPVTRLGKGSDRVATKLRQGRRAAWPHRYLVRSAYLTTLSQEPVAEELLDLVGTRDGLALRPAAF
jgi:hypothetical protein